MQVAMSGFEPDRAKQPSGLFRAERSEVSRIGEAKTRNPSWPARLTDGSD